VNFSIDPELSANLTPNTYCGAIRVTSPGRGRFAHRLQRGLEYCTCCNSGEAGSVPSGTCVLCRKHGWKFASATGRPDLRQLKQPGLLSGLYRD
jgi:hypothetical protein